MSEKIILPHPAMWTSKFHCFFYCGEKYFCKFVLLAWQNLAEVFLPALSQERLEKPKKPSALVAGAASLSVSHTSSLRSWMSGGCSRNVTEFGCFLGFSWVCDDLQKERKLSAACLELAHTIWMCWFVHRSCWYSQETPQPCKLESCYLGLHCPHITH